MLAGRRSFESCLSTGNDTSLQECCPRYANEIAFFLYVYIALPVFSFLILFFCVELDAYASSARGIHILALVRVSDLSA